eukprot:3755813-Prymnesium_polylepis.1
MACCADVPTSSPGGPRPRHALHSGGRLKRQRTALNGPLSLPATRRREDVKIMIAIASCACRCSYGCERRLRGSAGRYERAVQGAAAGDRAR